MNARFGAKLPNLMPADISTYTVEPLHQVSAKCRRRRLYLKEYSTIHALNTMCIFNINKKVTCTFCHYGNSQYGLFYIVCDFYCRPLSAFRKMAVIGEPVWWWMWFGRTWSYCCDCKVLKCMSAIFIACTVEKNIVRPEYFAYKLWTVRI